MEQRILIEIGLSAREIAVYRSLLKLGTTTTGPIVKESGVPNSKIYEILNKLIEKGLSSYIFKGKVKHFQASDPKTLLNLYENKKTKLKQTIIELNIIKNKTESPQYATTYEGTKAIKALLFEMYDYIGKNAEYCVFPIGEQLGTKELIQFFGEVLIKQQEMKIRIRALPHKSIKPIYEKHYGQYKYIQMRYMDYKFPTGIFIFKNHVLNVIWNEKPIAFLIKSKENYVRWQDFFNEQWIKTK